MPNRVQLFQMVFWNYLGVAESVDDSVMGGTRVAPLAVAGPPAANMIQTRRGTAAYTSTPARSSEN